MSQDSPPWLSLFDNHLMLDVVVVARGARSRVMGVEDRRLKIQLASSPDDNRINPELVQFLATTIGVSRAQIQIVGGASNLRKTVLMTKVSRNQVVLALSPRG